MTIMPIRCPKCGGERRVEVPDNACLFFYTCECCNFTVRPLPGDCCRHLLLRHYRLPTLTSPTVTAKQTADLVEVVAYDPRWAETYTQEHESLLATTGHLFVELEHIGSTAVPGLQAKPIIDIMAAVHRLAEVEKMLPALTSLGYRQVETDMRNRLFFRKQDSRRRPTFHLHIVELSTWAERKERLMRDYLLEHPEEARAYGELKEGLARTYATDSLAYTKAKTAFIQGLVDKARKRLGLASIDVWNEE